MGVWMKWPLMSSRVWGFSCHVLVVISSTPWALCWLSKYLLNWTVVSLEKYLGKLTNVPLTTNSRVGSQGWSQKYSQVQWEEGNKETQNYIKPCLFPALSCTPHSPDIPSLAQCRPIWSLIICPVEAQIIQPSGFSLFPFGFQIFPSPQSFFFCGQIAFVLLPTSSLSLLRGVFFPSLYPYPFSLRSFPIPKSLKIRPGVPASERDHR